MVQTSSKLFQTYLRVNVFRGGKVTELIDFLHDLNAAYYNILAFNRLRERLIGVRATIPTMRKRAATTPLVLCAGQSNATLKLCWI